MIFVLIAQQRACHGVNRIFLHACQTNRTRLDGLRTLGLTAQNQNRLSKARCFLLQSAGIRHDHVAASHQIVHFIDSKRLNQMNAFVTGQIFCGGFAHIRAEMHRIYNINILKVIRQTAQSTHDMFHCFTVVLSAMCRDENHAAVLIVQLIEGVITEYKIRIDRRVNCIDNGVAAHNDTLRNALCCQILAVALGRRKVQLGNLAGQLSVHFLRKRRILVKRAQTCFYVSYRNFMIERSQCTCKRRRCIAVNQNDVRLCFIQHLIQSDQRFCRNGCQCLARLHNVQIIVCLQMKNVHDLIQHLTMLRRDAHDGFYTIRALQLVHQRSHFNGLRPCAKDCHYLNCLHCQILRDPMCHRYPASVLQFFVVRSPAD